MDHFVTFYRHFRFFPFMEMGIVHNQLLVRKRRWTCPEFKIHKLQKHAIRPRYRQVIWRWNMWLKWKIAVKKAIEEKILDPAEDRSVVLFYDLNRIRFFVATFGISSFSEGIRECIRSFPPFWLHTMAVKANAIEVRDRTIQFKGKENYGSRCRRRIRIRSCINWRICGCSSNQSFPFRSNSFLNFNWAFRKSSLILLQRASPKFVWH